MPAVSSAGDQEPLLTGKRPLHDESDSDEGEILFERRTSVVPHDADEGACTRLTYEEAVEAAGFGPFHWLLLLVCGWANASDAVEIVCVSFLLPTARCDLQLSSSDMGLLTASIFLGMMVGGYVWGYLADQRGRCNVLVVSLSVNGLFGGLASAAPWFWLFLLLRFISGVGVGGSIPVIFSYFSEFMPRLRRGTMISALATFWMAGNILAAGLAWLVIPRTWIRFSVGRLDFQSWRVFVALCSVPSVTSAVIFRLLMPESPKFLMEAGRERDAVHVFRQMFRLNTRGKGLALPEFSLHVNAERRTRQTETRRPCGRLAALLKKGAMPVRQMFGASLKSKSVPLLVIFYCISFGVRGGLLHRRRQPPRQHLHHPGDGQRRRQAAPLRQPAAVQPERLPHLRGADQEPKSAPVLPVQRRVRRRLERSGSGGHRALPHAATLVGAGLLHGGGPSGGHHGERGLWQHGGLGLRRAHPAGVGHAADRRRLRALPSA
ncbi:synaptic vesicle glycoprotein 2C isoform X3 [Festucalex cinctus]